MRLVAAACVALCVLAGCSGAAPAPDPSPAATATPAASTPTLVPSPAAVVTAGATASPTPTATATATPTPSPTATATATPTPSPTPATREALRDKILWGPNETVGNYTRYELHGTVSNEGDDTVTVTVRPRVNVDDDCRVDLAFDPAIEITLAPGESWRGDPWEFTIDANRSIRGATVLPGEPWC